MKSDEPPEHGGAPAPQLGSGPSATPADAQFRAKALSRWEGKGGALGPARTRGDALDDSELRILARIGAATLAEWAGLPGPVGESMLASVCRPLAPGDGARVKARIAGFLRDKSDR